MWRCKEKMRSTCKTLIIALIFVLACGVVTFAEEITPINDLVEKAKAMDKKEVVIRGEAIGEIMKRGKFSWVNINDGSNVIGVWGDNETISKISKLGDYKNKGDIVEVKGEFHRDCSEHGGDVDIHLGSMEIIERGKINYPEIDSFRAVMAAMLFVTTIIFGGVYYKIRSKNA